MLLVRFIKDCAAEAFSGGRGYRGWLLLLSAVIGVGVGQYVNQLLHGLIRTGMSDQVAWGFYIANFAFLVGIAASAVLLVVPAYIFHRQDMKDVVLIGEGMAAAAVVMSILFIVVDLGRPDRLWHMLPIIGKFNFPVSLLAWDVVVLSGYLLINLAIPFYVLFRHYQAKAASSRAFFALLVISMFWAISIHAVTAFLFSANPARPLWHSALLAPRFIASAFVSGPALIILSIQIIRRAASFPISPGVINTLALIMAVAMQINVFFIGAELFTDFYNEGAHSASIRYLYLGLGEFSALQPWILVSLAMNLVALVILMINPLRNDLRFLNMACLLAFVGIWIEKGLGLVVPGFIPTPLGEIFEYHPTYAELFIAAGIWALGLLIFTLSAKAAVAIKQNNITASRTAQVSGDGM